MLNHVSVGAVILLWLVAGCGRSSEEIGPPEIVGPDPTREPSHQRTQELIRAPPTRRPARRAGRHDGRRGCGRRHKRRPRPHGVPNGPFGPEMVAVPAPDGGFCIDERRCRASNTDFLGEGYQDGSTRADRLTFVEGWTYLPRGDDAPDSDNPCNNPRY
jgi:hypothetical protein